ncbi:LOB domain-containing protein 23-like [Cornus florida]|uniref:LOB domain-containing protein 23-like n=1 Tax=Cornus florida TaxID=4283 RepID=UPI00289AC528|nr:LOB domain-containing protein 23-like [Cornus florida]
MTSTRCAACKYLRRRCPSDCIFAPYFPSNNPPRFSCVHRIYGASNIGRMLRELPVHLRAEAADSLHYEAQCRIQNPVYGCAGIISALHQQIYKAQSEVARVQADIAFLMSNTSSVHEQNVAAPSFNNMTFLAEQNSTVGQPSHVPSTTWFY